MFGERKPQNYSKENKLKEKEKEYFSKVLSSYIRKMEENSSQNSFYLKPEQLMITLNRPQIVIVRSEHPSSREGKEEHRKFRKKGRSEFAE
jgi:Mg2+ and Co2+ transporter CorA